MSTINIDLAADTILNVMIGQQDENEVREVVFDFSGWYTTYGSGTISLAIQRAKDEWPYEGELTVDSTNHKATWEISDTDTAYAGTGQVQLSYKVGDAKKKSVVYRFTCHKSLGALGSVVTPIQIQTFIDEVEEELQTMDGKLDDMEDEIADVRAELEDISNVIDDYLITEEATPTATPVTTSPLFTKLEDTNSAPNPNTGYRNQIRLSSDDKYDTYYYVLPNSTDVYFSANTYPYYVAISYGEKFDKVEGNSIYCDEGEETYRKRTSDNNLPTQGTPLSLGAGAVIAVTIRKGYTIDIYGLETVTSYQYAESLVAKIEEIIDGDVKRAKVIYDNTVSGYNTERLYVYMPTKTGYIRYNFEHFERADINADVWLIHPVYAVSNSLVEDFAVTTAGEFECALKINGAPDFMGGSSHGSEVMQSICFFLDGKLLNPEDITTLTDFDVLRIVEQSKLYDPNDEVTEAGIHGKEYIFSDGKLTINQSVKWSASFNLATSYMAMLPIAKSVSPYYVPNDNYQTYETANEYIRRAGITSVITWDTVKNMSVRFSIPLWNIEGTNIVESGTYLITDNSSPSYNKQYYICTSGGSVSSGDLWRTTTEYVIEVG